MRRLMGHGCGKEEGVLFTFRRVSAMYGTAVDNDMTLLYSICTAGNRTQSGLAFIVGHQSWKGRNGT